LNKARHCEKIQMKKFIKAHEEKEIKIGSDKQAQEGSFFFIDYFLPNFCISIGAVPAYLLDRETQNRAKVVLCSINIFIY
jgi:hypothetical protein